MRETYTFRITEEYAERFLKEDEGRKIGQFFPSVRVLTLSSDDPRFEDIHGYYNVVRRENHFFFPSYDVVRKYDKQELSIAEYFQPILYWIPYHAEIYGTFFDQSNVCSICRAGRVARPPFFLNTRRLPVSKDMFITMDGQVIVSGRMADLISENAITGCCLEPVHHTTSVHDDNQPVRYEDVPSGRELQSRALALGMKIDSYQYGNWLNEPEQKELTARARQEYFDKFYRDRPAGKRRFFHLRPDAQKVRFAPEVITGTGVFDLDPDNTYRCPLRTEVGHLAGFRLVSELSFLRNTHPGTDIAFTGDFLGERYPYSLMIMSRRFQDLCKAAGMKGYNVEIAHAR